MSVGDSDGTKEMFKEDVFPCDHDQEINHRLSDHNLIPMESSPETRTILPDFFSLPKTSGDGDSAIQKKELRWPSLNHSDLIQPPRWLKTRESSPFLTFWDCRDMMIHPDLGGVILMTLQFWIDNKYVSYHVCWRSWISMCFQHRFGSCWKSWNHHVTSKWMIPRLAMARGGPKLTPFILSHTGCIPIWWNPVGWGARQIRQGNHTRTHKK